MAIRKSTGVSILVAIVLLAAGLFLYPALPEELASHWGLQGEVNGYMPKFLGVIFIPLVVLAMAAIFEVIPRIDPYKENIKKFSGEYGRFVVLLSAFLAAIQAMVLAWNLGYLFDMSRFIFAGIGILFFFIGDILEKSKRNWFVGVRTPWTLVSDRVWEKTNKLGGRAFRAIGIVMAIGAIFYKPLVIELIAVVLLLVFGLFVYSYLEFRKIKK
ncbi:MAG: SdpI family protein [Candidatus Aenigmarchaeota archaeon]|nr:SdpI family protein [Candidatus Aenigmarchaeota archaeon]